MTIISVMKMYPIIIIKMMVTVLLLVMVMIISNMISNEST